MIKKTQCLFLYTALPNCAGELINQKVENNFFPFLDKSNKKFTEKYCRPIKSTKTEDPFIPL
jgi:hypothetical protein